MVLLLRSSYKNLRYRTAPAILRRYLARRSNTITTVTPPSQNYTSSAPLFHPRSPQRSTSSHFTAKSYSTRINCSAPTKHEYSPNSARQSRQSSPQSFHRLPRPLEGNLLSWTPLVLVGAAVLLYSVVPGNSESSSNQGQSSQTLSGAVLEFEKKSDNMTGESLAGRPGTLTPEEEEKLRELWVATLEVFGVLDPKDVSGHTTSDASSVTAGSETADSKKPKKKRMSMFRKKDADADTKEVEAEDKHGQTKEFHDALANMSPASLRATFWSMVKHDHPDALLLRFLRARKWDVNKALIMMVSTMRWRSTEVHVDDDIMKNGELGALEDSNGSDPAKKKMGQDFLTQMRMGKSFLHGVDGEGRPMCFVRVRLHKQGEQSEESVERYTIFIIETARMVLAPPVDTACVVFDMTGFSMANMDYAPVKFMIKCFEANYPESLGVVLVHKAPWLFQGIWKIIRGWLDPVVASKIQFTSNKAEMEKFVPNSQIIKDLDGAEDWSWDYVEPVPGENDAMKDTATRDKLLQGRELIVNDYEKATVDWIQGTGDAPANKIKRNEIANKLRDDYWKLDPYVRARSVYDRVGMLGPGGKLQFYHSKMETVAAAAPGANRASKVETSADDID